MSQQDIDRFSLGPAFIGVAEQVPVPPPLRPAIVTEALDLRVLELLTARLCHELSGPIAAINNGVELLIDEPVLASDGQTQASCKTPSHWWVIARVAPPVGYNSTASLTVSVVAG
jgi:hypothetical protein